ncbi:acyl-CoA reductase [Kitasatospora sp. NPDC001175]|uniref:acyl-CoA reductase n=1 Tax=Kitasatospora sp. NPDC001175 TaxID=3157103 RepID=UPI003CFD1219
MTDVKHLWQGEWIDGAEAGRRLADLDTFAAAARQLPLRTEAVIEACTALAAGLAGAASADRDLLAAELGRSGASEQETAAVLGDLAGLLRRDALERVLTAQLGTTSPATPVPAGSGAAEYWAPVGMVAHVLPGNVATAGPWSLVEGLLTGNLNVAKTTGGSRFVQLFAEALAGHDPSGAVAALTIVLSFPSRNRDWLRTVCQAADSVVVWGTEEAVAGVAEHVGPGRRLVAWGPKISFAYLTEAAWSDPGILADLARSVCRHDQQACTSPQALYLDTEDDDQLFAVAERLAEALAEAAAGLPQPTPTLQERAEITTTVTVARLEQHLGHGRVLADPEGRWRVLADRRSELAVSPLFRTVWVRPLPRKRIPAVLRPLRSYLQTVGLAAAPGETGVLADEFVRAGALRVTAVGAMSDSYPGEPHDGLLALQQHSRRVLVPRV